MADHQTITRSSYEMDAATSSVLRNTYLLLALTLMTSAATAGLAMVMNAAPMGPFMFLIGYFALLFATTKLRNSVWGLAAVFALTGFMGFYLGPILNFYIHGMANGSMLVMQALGGTALIFFSLSAIVLVTRKNFNFLSSFLMVGLVIGLISIIAGLFFHTPMMSLIISAIFMFISSAMILYQTSQIIHGGETNYITATVTLYVALFNLFISLLNILSILNGRD